MLVYRLRLPKRSDYQLVFKNLWTFQILWIYLLLKGRRWYEKENRNNADIDFSNRNIHSLYGRRKNG